MRRVIAGMLSVVALAVPPAARANAVTHDPCPDVIASVGVFATVTSSGHPDILENLGFDGLGHMWVSDSTSARVMRFDNGGFSSVSFALPGPGAINLRPDGTMTVNFGGGIAGALQRSHSAGVATFDPSSSSPAPATFASGWNMANGGTFDADGNLYTSNDVDAEVTKIRPDGTLDTAWSASADVWGTNGLVVKDGILYAAVTFDQRSPIEAIPLNDPASHYTVAQTTFGVLSLEPGVYADPSTNAPLVGLKGFDDMTLGPDGRLWVVANGMGELLRVDLDTGQVCLIASGLQNPSSVRFADEAFGTKDVFISEFSGTIRRIRLS